MQITVQDETERKYDVDGAATLPSLVGLDGVAGVAEATTVDHEAVYFDTAGLDLARRGITLRRRTGGEDEGWHLKVPSDRDDTRTELRLPLGRAVRIVPKPLLGPVRAIVRDRSLVPVARVLNHRVTLDLLDGGATVLARVCDDSVTGESLLRAATTKHWREWEVELSPGSALHLDLVEQPLLDAGAARATATSKLARVLEVHRQPRPTRAGGHRAPAKATASQVLVARLAEHRDRLHRHDAGVRADRPGSVHRMRIAVRRLRSALTTYRPLLEPDHTDQLRADLRWLGQSLSPARDAEVLRERLDALVAEQPAELVMGPVARRIDKTLSEAAREGRKQAQAALDSPRYFRLLDALDAFVEDPPVLAAADGRATRVVPRLLRRDARRLHRAVEAAQAAGELHPDLALHEARKKAKRLRYAAESAIPALGRRARTLTKRAKRVQEALGDHQDTVVARATLRECGVQAHLSGENAFTYGLLHGLEERRATDSRESFERSWRHLHQHSILEG